MRDLADALSGTPSKRELDAIAAALSASRTAACSSESLKSVLQAYTRLHAQIVNIQVEF